MEKKDYKESLQDIYVGSYTVQKGDSLNRVAIMHGVSARNLAFVNKVLGDTLFPD